MGRRDIRHRGRRASVLGPAIAVGLWVVPSDVSAQTVLPDINVIAPTPLSGTRSTKPSNAPAGPGARTGARQGAPTTGGTPTAAGAAGPADLTSIERDKLPSNTEVLTSTDFSHEYTNTFLDALNRGLPGVSLSDQNGNAYQKDLNYRGFTASPVQGTPQGIAIYQNGVRVNESWGDVVNWDFIPEKAIDKVSLFPSNPVFGLNAIGGALSIQMKNGFTWQGAEFEAMGGSYDRAQGSVQIGKQDGNLAAYGLFESAYDKGWRDFASSSHVNRMYVDVGGRNEDTEFHISFTGADNTFGNVASTPLAMLSQNYGSVFTWPQSTHLQLAFLQANLTHNFSDTLSFQGNAYYRGFWQQHIDGNGTDAFPCSKDGDPGTANGGNAVNPQHLCVSNVTGQAVYPAFGTDPIYGVNPVLDPVAHTNLFLGELDDNQVSSNTFGGTAQFTSTMKVFGRENHFVVGASVDHGYTQFNAQSILGVEDPQTLYTAGLGLYLNQPNADFSIVNLHATNTYTGIFATDTFDVTDRLSITAGARFNIAQIDLQDMTGINPDLDSNSTYQRFNPMVGATYKITPNLTAYADYAEANRAPTPLESGCSSPTHPCMIDTFLVADPPLQQVISHTIEGGLRGKFGNDIKSGLVTWGLGVFHTELDNDIVNVASQVTQTGDLSNFGFFQNIPKDLRQGVEAKIDYTNERLKLYANYTYVDATYQSNATLSSPNNPNAQCVGSTLTLAQLGDACNGPFVNVQPGDHIGGIPAHRFKAGAEYAVTDKWKVGADLNVVGSSYLVHDDTNQYAKVPAYAVLNLHTSYQLTPNVELFGVINNALDQHYYLFGTFADGGGFTAANNNNPNTLGTFSDPRSFVPGAPFAAYAGLRARF
jgi:iron complex outermembrane recepter protein